MRLSRPLLIGVVAVAVAAVDVTAAATSGGQATQPTAATAPAPAPAAAATSAPAITPKPAPVTMWVAVAAANVWDKVKDVRRVDRPALGAHPNLARWVHVQTLAQWRFLAQSLMTQALRGEPVVVLATTGPWARVRVVNQRGAVYRDGIVGWVWQSQLSTHPVHVSAAPLPHRGSSLIRAAAAYLRAPYIFGGMTRIGIDCSGLTYMAAQRLGVRLPRDAADQALVGRPVRRAALRPGDLVFFGPGARGTIHHVGIYLGRGLVLHAPHTGSWVRVTKLSTFADYWGARRIVPAG